MKRQVFSRLFVGLGLLGMFSAKAEAQYVRSSYFMDGVEYKMQLNPALTPNRGYIHIPFLGGANASLSSNSLSVGDVKDILKHSTESKYFTSDGFMNKLQNKNQIDASINFTLLGAGWYYNKNFWSVEMNLRNDIQASVPKEQFTFMREADAFKQSQFKKPVNASFQNEKLTVNTFSELAVGWARTFNKLMVGTRVKLLTGYGHAEMNVQKASLVSTPAQTQIDIQADVQGYFKGIEMETGEKNKVTGLKLNSMGVAGMGFGVDLGAAYQVTDQLTVSAGLTDLGMISWNKSTYQEAQSKGTTIVETSLANIHSKEELEQRLNDAKVFDYDLLALKKVENSNQKSKTSHLSPTLTLGASYELLNNTITLGALYTNRFTPMKNFNELTLSGNYKPTKNIDLTVSYSMIQSGGKGLGLAVKLGPIFMGTDYLFFGNSSKAVNGILGVTIPLGKRKR